MPVIIGTAGHIDHGKTSLVRALTGRDTDRLPEEKERGISIDLGFAYFDTPDGERAGIVDVPGHERFIRNMLAGAHGMDLVLFTVAADDGVMPQTEEHLDILHHLGVRRGIWIVTKIDLVDAARVAAVREEIEILAVDSTLEGAPIVAVSTVTHEGLDLLRTEMMRQLAQPSPPAPSGPFRLPVDRAFVLHGHGVVVTGTAVAGTVREGEAVRMLPGGEVARVRSLQVHGEPVAMATHGQRVAMNLAGVERGDLGRGHVVCDERLSRTTTRFDAFVEIRRGARRPLESHGRLRVHVGTAEVIGKVVVLEEGARLLPGQRGWAQLVLTEPVLALRGDRFILRDETARWTLGGGMVVNPFTDRHRPRERGLAEKLLALRDGDEGTAARTLLDLIPDFACECTALAQALNVDAPEIQQALAAATDVVAIPDARNAEAYTTRWKWDRLVAAVTAHIGKVHRERPLDPGVEMEHLRSQLASELSAKTFRWCIDRMVERAHLARQDDVVRLPTHEVALDVDARMLGEEICRLLAEEPFAPPDLRQLAAVLKVDRAQMISVLGVLEKERRVVRVAAELYYATTAVDDVKRLLAEHCRAHGEISAGSFRDLIGSSRKFAIALLDWCDRTGVTTRVGDMRRLRR